MEDFKWNFAQSNPTPVNDTEFRWNWAKANVDPSYKVQSPGIGSLLRAINPETQSDAINQMNAEFARDNAAREMLMKQGAAENKILEDLWNQNYKENYDSLQQAKNQTAKLNARNDAIKNYANALQSGDEAQIELAKTQIQSMFPEEAEGIFAKGKEASDLATIQYNNFVDLSYELNDSMTTKQKEAFKKKVIEYKNDNKITAKQAQELLTTVGDVFNPTLESIKKHTGSRIDRSVKAAEQQSRQDEQRQNNSLLAGE